MPFTSSRLIVFGVLAAFVCGVGAASAQTPTLAELAKREEARRKTTPPPTRVITNADLPRVTTPAPAPVSPSAEPGDASGAQAPAGGAAAGDNASRKDDKAPAADKDKQDEKYWRGRITLARTDLARSEVLAEALQSRVNALTTDFANRDDPFQRARVGDDRQKALAELDRLQQEIAALKKDIDDIEEEARRAGVPPGWLR